jgi:hypothetical protein
MKVIISIAILSKEETETHSETFCALLLEQTCSDRVTSFPSWQITLPWPGVNLIKLFWFKFTHYFLKARPLH